MLFGLFYFHVERESQSDKQAFHCGTIIPQPCYNHELFLANLVCKGLT